MSAGVFGPSIQGIAFRYSLLLLELRKRAEKAVDDMTDGPLR
jgi:hypothetical protein